MKKILIRYKIYYGKKILWYAKRFETIESWIKKEGNRPSQMLKIVDDCGSFPWRIRTIRGQSLKRVEFYCLDAELLDLESWKSMKRRRRKNGLRVES